MRCLIERLKTRVKQFFWPVLTDDQYYDHHETYVMGSQRGSERTLKWTKDDDDVTLSVTDFEFTVLFS